MEQRDSAWCLTSIRVRPAMKRIAIFGLLISLMLVGGTVVHGKTSSSHTAYLRGKRQAMTDLRFGRLRIRTYGLPSPYFWDYSRRLEERYGVETVGVAGCVVSDRIRAMSRG